jgi:hypothetical protein
MFMVAWLVIRHCFPEDTPVQCIGHVVVVMWAALVLICVTLGTAGCLKPVWLGTGGLTIAGLAAVWLARQLSKAHGARPVARRWVDLAWRGRAIVLGWGFLGTVVGVGVIERGVLRFPNDWDSLMYHIPFIDQWLQSGSLYAPADAVWYNPGNAELMGLWIVAPFSGDFWVGLANTPIALLLIFGTLELGRQLGLSPVLGHAAAVTVLANRVFLRQIATNENDLAVAGLFIAGIAYGMRYVRVQRSADMVLAAIALGLLAGVKYYALGYAAVAWTGLMLLTLRCGGGKQAAFLTAAGVVTTVALGSYWYVRNFSLTGTPVYPLGFSERTNVLEHIRPGIWNSSLLGNGRIELLPQWIVAVFGMTGPCQVVAVLASPLSLSWLLGRGLLSSGAQVARASEANSRWLLSFLLAGSLFIFGITPNIIDPESGGRSLVDDYLPVRFGLAPLILSVLALGLTLQDMAHWQRGRWPGLWFGGFLSMAPVMAFIGLAATQVLCNLDKAVDQAWLVVLFAAVDLVAVAILVRGTFVIYQVRRIIVAGLITSLMLVSISSDYLSREWHRNFSEHYNNMFGTTIFSMIDKTIISRPIRIAVLDYCYYPYFGSRRQHQVHRPWFVRSESSLISYLATHHIDLVAVTREDRFFIGRYRNSHDIFINNKKLFKNINTGVNFDCYVVHKNYLKERLADIRPDLGTNN